MEKVSSRISWNLICTLCNLGLCFVVAAEQTASGEIIGIKTSKSFEESWGKMTL